MGLIKELFDEVIPLPDSRVNHIDIDSKINSYHFKFWYALLNLFFQIIDCIVIPFYALIFYESLKHGWGFLKLGGLVALGFSSIFSFYQTLYWFFKSPDDFVSFKDRLLGETAIGAFLSAVFRFKINYFWKR